MPVRNVNLDNNREGILAVCISTIAAIHKTLAVALAIEAGRTKHVIPMKQL